MKSYLERLRQELEETTGRAGELAMTQSPAGKWSAAEILEHLFLTYQQSHRALQKCLDQGTPLATSATLKHRFAALVVVSAGYIPEGRKAPERAMPKGMALEEVRKGIANELEKMSLALTECERKFGKRAKIMDHPFLGPLTANQWRKFHLVHGRHHLRQIRERLSR